MPALAAVLENTAEHPMVRHEAAEALGSIATDECLPVLERFLKDEQVRGGGCICVVRSHLCRRWRGGVVI